MDLLLSLLLFLQVTTVGPCPLVFPDGMMFSAQTQAQTLDLVFTQRPDGLPCDTTLFVPEPVSWMHLILTTNRVTIAVDPNPNAYSRVGLLVINAQVLPVFQQ